MRSSSLHEATPVAAALDVCIVGMGYVGLTLAAALAEAGLRVLGHDRKPEVCAALAAGRLHIRERGVGEVLERRLGENLWFAPSLPEALPRAVVLCVGTPVEPGSHRPDLSQLAGALDEVAPRIGPETLCVLRSTVPVGTARGMVLPALRRSVDAPLLAVCPERTIQGMALEELRSLPQIVGAAGEAAAARAEELFGALGVRTLRVSSLEAAEMVKLINNAHTDLIYGFGNEVALMAEALGLDARELISAANVDYPRPDLNLPGYVGGGCLSKDPYLLISSVEGRGYFPRMVAAARTLNEELPGRTALRALAALAAAGREPREARVLVCGFAYKGVPETDDLRGSPALPVVAALRGRVARLLGHDFVVAPEAIAALGAEPVDLAGGCAGADAVLVLNNHPGYRGLDLGRLAASLRRPAVLYDAWGIFRERRQELGDVHYLELGRA